MPRYVLPELFPVYLIACIIRVDSVCADHVTDPGLSRGPSSVSRSRNSRLGIPTRNFRDFRGAGFIRFPRACAPSPRVVQGLLLWLKGSIHLEHTLLHQAWFGFTMYTMRGCSLATRFFSCRIRGSEPRIAGLMPGGAFSGSRVQPHLISGFANQGQAILDLSSLGSVSRLSSVLGLLTLVVNLPSQDEGAGGQGSRVWFGLPRRTPHR